MYSPAEVCTEVLPRQAMVNKCNYERLWKKVSKWTSTIRVLPYDPCQNWCEKSHFSVWFCKNWQFSQKSSSLGGKFSKVKIFNFFSKNQNFVLNDIYLRERDDLYRKIRKSFENQDLGEHRLWKMNIYCFPKIDFQEGTANTQKSNHMFCQDKDRKWELTINIRALGMQNMEKVTHFSHKSFQFCFDISNGALCLTIRLRPTCACDSDIDLVALVELFLQVVAELWAHIMHDAFSRAHIATVDLLVDENGHGHWAFVG